MGFTTRLRTYWQGRARSILMLGFSALLGIHVATAQAGQIQIDLLFDTSQSVAGCSVTTLERVINGVDQRVRVVADDVTKIVSTVETSICSGSTFGTPQPISTSWTYTNGVSDDAIRGSIPKSLFSAPLLGVVLISSAQTGVTTDVLDGGNTTGFANLVTLAEAANVPVPTIHPILLFAMGMILFLFGMLTLRKKGRIFSVFLMGAVALSLSPILTYIPSALAAISSITITEPAAQATSELASIGRGNILSTTISLDTTLNVYNVDIRLSPTINGISVAQPPDPVANGASIAGIDVNKNGVRDDVERVIALNSPTNFSLHMQIAKLLQQDITGTGNISTAERASIFCLAANSVDGGAIELLSLDNVSRLEAFYKNRTDINLPECQ
jgi:hypothetical protein